MGSGQSWRRGRHYTSALWQGGFEGGILIKKKMENRGLNNSLFKTYFHVVKNCKKRDYVNMKACFQQQGKELCC